VYPCRRIKITQLVSNLQALHKAESFELFGITKKGLNLQVFQQKKIEKFSTKLELLDDGDCVLLFKPSLSLL